MVRPPLANIIHLHTPSRSLKSIHQNLFAIPRLRLKTCGDRAFAALAPRLWNTLPTSIRVCCGRGLFKGSIEEGQIVQASICFSHFPTMLLSSMHIVKHFVTLSVKTYLPCPHLFQSTHFCYLWLQPLCCVFSHPKSTLTDKHDSLQCNPMTSVP